MDIDKMIKDKTESFVGNGDYYFEYITPEDCKKIVEEALKQERESPIDSASKCYSEKDIDNAYDKGFNDGNQRDLTSSLIEVL